MENSILSVNIQLQLDKNLVLFSLLMVPLLPPTTEVTLHILLFSQGKMKVSVFVNVREIWTPLFWSEILVGGCGTDTLETQMTCVEESLLISGEVILTQQIMHTVPEPNQMSFSYRKVYKA